MEMAKKTESILQEVKKAIVGKDEVVSKVLMAILAQGNILLEDAPGVGKTTLALAFSRTLSMDYNRIQFTPDVVPSDIIGFSVYNKATGEMEFKQGAVMTNLLLADEINRTSSKTQAALLEAMEERQVTVDGQTHVLPSPFVVIATQNPVGSAGTQLLPQAQLDRFMVRLSMGYPDSESQFLILKDRQRENPLYKLHAAVTVPEILKMQEEVVDLHVEDSILRYITRIAEASREHALVQQGISPRGALALCRMAKACAYVKGRDYVIPEDVAEVFTEVCAHRLILAPKARITDTSAEDILSEILERTSMEDHKRR